MTKKTERMKRTDWRRNEKSKKIKKEERRGRKERDLEREERRERKEMSEFKFKNSKNSFFVFLENRLYF